MRGCSASPPSAGGQQDGDDGLLARPPNFLRLLIVFTVRPPAAGEREGEIRAVYRIRQHALDLLREQLAGAFGDDPLSPVTDLLARLALAAIDGAFVASQADPATSIEQLLEPLPASLAATRRSLLSVPD